MKNKKLRKLLIIILIIIVFIGGIFAGKAIEARKYSKDGSETSTQISETTVSTQTIENTLTSSGEVTSSETEKLDLSTSNYFKTMCVEKNDIVKKGGKILRYSDGTYLKAENVIAVAKEAVSTSNGKSYVKLKESNGNIKQTEITTGISNDAYTEVKSGLNEGDIVYIEKSISSSNGSNFRNRQFQGMNSGNGQGQRSFQDGDRSGKQNGNSK